MIINNKIKENFSEMETIHQLPFGQLQLIQNTDYFCYGIDAVLLSHFATRRKHKSYMDFCTGNGIIPLCISALNPLSTIKAMEIQDQVADLAIRSVKLNNLEKQIEILKADLKQTRKIFPERIFDAVTVNPPYMKANSARINPDNCVAIARHEIECSLKDVIDAAAAVLKPRGRFYLIHRPIRLNDIFENLFMYKFSVERMQFIHPSIGKSPNMVLLECQRDTKPETKIEKPLFVYKAPGEYSDEIIQIYSQTK